MQPRPLVGSLQGGELRSESEEGVFTLQLEKMRMYISMMVYLLGCPEWDHQAASAVLGRLVFAAAFCRPLLSVLEETSFQVKGTKGRSEPGAKVITEMVSMVGLIPLAFTNVRVAIYRLLSATDASPTGAGSCVAEKLKRVPGVPGLRTTSSAEIAAGT